RVIVPAQPRVTWAAGTAVERAVGIAADAPPATAPPVEESGTAAAVVSAAAARALAVPAAPRVSVAGAADDAAAAAVGGDDEQSAPEVGSEFAPWRLDDLDDAGDWIARGGVS